MFLTFCGVSGLVILLVFCLLVGVDGGEGKFSTSSVLLRFVPAIKDNEMNPPVQVAVRG